MGVMNKLRESTPIVLWTLVLSFGILWVLQDTQVFDNIGFASAQRLAVVDGTEITYEQYQRALDQQLQQYQMQTGESVPDQLIDAYREQVFNALIDNVLREREMERLGITVSDAEVIEMTMGEDPDPFIREQFSDGAGGIDRAALRSALDNADARDQWILVEEYLRNKRRQEKLDRLIAATVRVSEGEVTEEYRRRNKRADISYVALRYADIADDSVSVDDRFMRRFYGENREDFQREKTWTVSYVGFSKLATREDTLRVSQELAALTDQFAAAEDDSVFVARQGSERPFTSAFFRPDELDPELAEAIYQDVTPGRVVGPVQVGGTFHLAKILDTRPLSDTAVRARHILIRSADTEEAEVRSEARQKAADLAARIRRGEDFAALAREFSEDPGSGMRGGDLGWFGPDRMVKPFEDAAFAARVGQVVGPVETQFGYHLIEVQERASREVQIADLAYSVTPSSATLRLISERADDLQYFASESGDLAAEASKNGLSVEEVSVQEGMDFIPGIGNARAVLNFLAEAGPAAVSEVLDRPDQVLVMQVKSITPAGIRPYEEVVDEIRPRALLEAKKQRQIERLRSASASSQDLNAVAGRLGTSVQAAQGLSFTNLIIPGAGREPRVVGRALGASEAGLLPEVIEGESAAFLVRVTNTTEPDVANIPEATRLQIRQELLNRKRQQVQSSWLARLRDAAEIEDNRSRFSL